MNNRFNFRHWDKQINKMRYGDIHLSSSGEPFILHCETGKLLSIEDIDDVITMQCTGRKDKNGTLIYERDIIYVELEEDNALIEWNKHYARFDVYLIGQKVHIGFDGFDDLDDDCGDKLEVIGNIYENPELLKGVGNE